MTQHKSLVKGLGQFLIMLLLLFTMGALALSTAEPVKTLPESFTSDTKPKPMVKMTRLGQWDAAITCNNGIRPSLKIYDHYAVIVTCDPQDIPEQK